MQFGMPTLIQNRTIEDNIDLCAILGLNFIELNMSFPEYQVDRLEQADDLMRLAERAGLYYTIHLDEDLDIANFNPLVRTAYLETVRRAIEALRRMLSLRDRFGDKCQPLMLNMHMNHGIYITLPDDKVRMYERRFEDYMRAFVDFRARCEDWIGDDDVMIAIENTNGFRDYEKAAIEALLESPRFGLTWDVGHSKTVWEADEPFIMDHVDRLTHFHIHDATDMPPSNHLALGCGNVDLEARLSLAEERNARCVLETKSREALMHSVQWLEDRGYMHAH